MRRRPRRKEIRRGLRESVGLMGLMGLMGEVVVSLVVLSVSDWVRWCVVGSAVARDYLLAVAVGGEADGVSVIVGLDGDCGGLAHGVVDGESNGLNHGVVDGFIVGLHRDGLAASATR